MKTLIVSVPGYRPAFKASLLLALLFSRFITHAQSGPWNLAGGQAQSSTPFAVGIGTASPTADLHIFKDFSSSVPAVPVSLLRVNIDNGFGVSPLLDLLSNGRLALGSSTAHQRLHVQGSAYISQNLGINVAQPLQRFHLQGGNMLLENGDFAMENGNLNLNQVKINMLSGGSNVFSVEANGNVWARNVRVTAGLIPDFVFEADYCLMSLPELEQYLRLKKHLPGIPSAADYAAAGGVDMGELQLKLLQKVEELTLYLLAQQKQIEALQQALKAGQ